MKKIFVFLLVLVFVFIPFNVVYADNANQLESRRTDTPDGYRIDYVDDSGSVVQPDDRTYSTVVYHVEENIISEEYYFDVEGNPVAAWAGHYGFRRENYDDNNRPTKFTYLDENGNPFIITSGYAGFFRTYNNDGYAIKDLYFDVDGNLTKDNYGEGGVWYIRDNEGTHIGSGNIDSNSKLILNDRGYAIVLYDRDSDNRVVQRSYFGVNGEPITIGKGQHSEILEYDENGTVIDTYYKNLDGQIMFMLDEFLMHYVLLNAIIAIFLLLIVLLLPKWMRISILFIYIGFMLYMTVIDRVIDAYNNNTLLSMLKGEKHIDIKPFNSYKRMFESHKISKDLFNNILLFVPYGILLQSIFTKNITLKGKTINKFIFMFILIFSTTLIIELIQLFTGLGLFELDDLINNTMGGMIGCVIVFGLSKTKIFKQL